VDSFSVELGVLTNKYQRSALQLLQAFCQVMSSARQHDVLIPSAQVQVGQARIEQETGTY
jgi:hypothetical protein